MGDVTQTKIFWRQSAARVTSVPSRSTDWMRRPETRRLFGFERRYRVEEFPAEDAHQVDGGGDVEREVPVARSQLQNHADYEGAEGAADIAPHVHGAGEGTGVLAANVHAGGPCAGHHEVIGETGEADGEGRVEWVGHAGREHQEAGGSGEADVGHDTTRLSHARNPRQTPAEEHADRVGDAAEEQRCDAEERHLVDIEVAGFVEIGGQPGHVEIPAIGEAEILQAYHPDLLRRYELRPGDVTVTRGVGGSLREQRALGIIKMRIVARIVAIPTVEKE